MIRQRTAITIVAVLILIAEAVHAQVVAGRFRIDGREAQSKRGSPVYSGYIYNDGGGGVANVRLLIRDAGRRGQGHRRGSGDSAWQHARSRPPLLRSSPSGYRRELSSACAVVGYLRHRTVRLGGHARQLESLSPRRLCWR